MNGYSWRGWVKGTGKLPTRPPSSSFVSGGTVAGPSPALIIPISDDSVDRVAEYINGYMSGEYGEHPDWPMEACRKLASGLLQDLAYPPAGGTDPADPPEAS